MSDCTSPLAGRRVAVTGATGFLGGYVVHELRSAGAHILGIVDRTRATTRHGDLHLPETFWFDTPGQLSAAVRNACPDAVVHLHAALGSARDLAAIPSMIEANLLPSIALMSVCHELKVERLILLGSGEEFGPRTPRFDDATATSPVSPYGASKAAVTAFARMFANAFALPAVILRPAVVYGPHQAPRMLIPQVMHALREGREVPTTAGEQTRDFIHAGDVARGIVAALTAPAEAVTGRAWNLGTGEVVTVRDCLSRIEALTGTSSLIRYGALPYRAGELFRYEPVVDDAFAALAWRPRVSLDEGLARTWAALSRP